MAEEAAGEGDLKGLPLGPHQAEEEPGFKEG